MCIIFNLPAPGCAKTPAFFQATTKGMDIANTKKGYALNTGFFKTLYNLNSLC